MICDHKVKISELRNDTKKLKTIIFVDTNFLVTLIMFNPQFKKFRRKKIVVSKLNAKNKITNFFQSESTSSEDGNKVCPDAKRCKSDSDASIPVSSTKERLSQFSRKRRKDNQHASSSKISKKQAEKVNDSEGQDSKLTPFEQQVTDLKLKHPGMILMIQSGYKYFFYGEDAEIVSRVLNLSVYPNHNFMRSSIPIERLHVYARTLIEAGYKVGVIQQQEVAELKAISDSKNKVFDRELTAVYTKATAIGEEIDPLTQSVNKCSEEASAKFILCVAETNGTSSKPDLGIVAFDVGTGEAYYDKFEDNSNREELEKRVEHLRPAEILISEKLSNSSQIVLKHSKARLEVFPEEKFNFSSALLDVASFLSSASDACDAITNFPPPVVCALSALLNYLRTFKLEKTLMPENLQSFSKSELYVQLDGATLRNLEIFRTSIGTHRGSLIWLFDQFSHARFGSRVLREWLSRPLRDIETLRQRQDAVAELLSCSANSVVELYSVLQKMPDLEHGLTAVLLKRSTPKSTYLVLDNLKSLKVRLEAIIGASDVCINSPLLNKLIVKSVDLLARIPQFLDNMNEEAARKGDVSKFLQDYSFCPAVGELQKQVKSISGALEALLPNIASKLGLCSVKYTTVHGVDYLIEVKIKQPVPLDWVKVSETKHLSRYHLPDVICLRSELNVVKAQLKQECENAWKEYIDSFNTLYSDHKKAVRNIADLDALIALAQLARSGGYCRPDLTDDDVMINIQKGKHPIVSNLVSDFVPNDTNLESPETPCMVLSGPNMGGKSSYIKQVALITIMALIGSYVPAESACIGMIDAVYTRIGARDEIFEGRSTLMLEMQESATILRKATRHSLVLMDELGRGTSSHDGAAIAEAVLSHLILKIQCLTLFITHYPSVMDVAPDYNFHMGFIISKFGDDAGSEILTFLYLVSSGKTTHSYGLNVSRLAGIPESIIKKASLKAENLQVMNEYDRVTRESFLNLWNAQSLNDVRNAS